MRKPPLLNNMQAYLISELILTDDTCIKNMLYHENDDRKGIQRLGRFWPFGGFRWLCSDGQYIEIL